MARRRCEDEGMYYRLEKAAGYHTTIPLPRDIMRRLEEQERTEAPEITVVENGLAARITHVTEIVTAGSGADISASMTDSKEVHGHNHDFVPGVV
jgi:hypothetical protein